ncbi:hypothetical protein [Enterobacter sp.]|nr:hypothetical protein [Enterobacter sp.]
MSDVMPFRDVTRERGYPDLEHPANQYRIEKAPLVESVTFHQ